MRFSPWVVSEHVPDYSPLEQLLQGPRLGANRKGQAEGSWRGNRGISAFTFRYFEFIVTNLVRAGLMSPVLPMLNRIA